jgi:hypothetical protein
MVPRLRWHLEVEGWLVAGFDRVAGRHIDLTPGSAGLPAGDQQDPRRRR